MAGQLPDDGNATPRWVKVSGIIGAILVLLMVIHFLTGWPGMHAPA